MKVLLFFSFSSILFVFLSDFLSVFLSSFLFFWFFFLEKSFLSSWISSCLFLGNPAFLFISLSLFVSLFISHYSWNRRLFPFPSFLLFFLFDSQRGWISLSSDFHPEIRLESLFSLSIESIPWTVHHSLSLSLLTHHHHLIRTLDSFCCPCFDCLFQLSHSPPPPPFHHHLSFSSFPFHTPLEFFLPLTLCLSLSLLFILSLSLPLSSLSIMKSEWVSSVFHLTYHTERRWKRRIFEAKHKWIPVLFFLPSHFISLLSLERFTVKNTRWIMKGEAVLSSFLLSFLPLSLPIHLLLFNSSLFGIKPASSQGVAKIRVGRCSKTDHKLNHSHLVLIFFPFMKSEEPWKAVSVVKARNWILKAVEKRREGKKSILGKRMHFFSSLCRREKEMIRNGQTPTQSLSLETSSNENFLKKWWV